MIDVLEQLRSAQPMPRGERLARWWDTAMTTSGEARLWHRLWNTMEHQPLAARIRTYARPLRLARERLREARAERDALRAAVPTRAEVERAVGVLLLAVRAYESAYSDGQEFKILDAHATNITAARAALVALATRGSP